jgi:hypothetical protein
MISQTMYMKNCLKLPIGEHLFINKVIFCFNSGTFESLINVLIYFGSLIFIF